MQASLETTGFDEEGKPYSLIPFDDKLAQLVDVEKL